MLRYSILIHLFPEKSRELQSDKKFDLIRWGRATAAEFKLPGAKNENLQWHGPNCILMAWETESDGKVLYTNLRGGISRAETNRDGRLKLGIMNVQVGPDWATRVQGHKNPPPSRDHSTAPHRPRSPSPRPPPPGSPSSPVSLGSHVITPDSQESNRRMSPTQFLGSVLPTPSVSGSSSLPTEDQPQFNPAARRLYENVLGQLFQLRQDNVRQGKHVETLVRSLDSSDVRIDAERQQVTRLNKELSEERLYRRRLEGQIGEALNSEAQIRREMNDQVAKGVEEVLSRAREEWNSRTATLLGNLEQAQRERDEAREQVQHLKSRPTPTDGGVNPTVASAVEATTVREREIWSSRLQQEQLARLSAERERDEARHALEVLEKDISTKETKGGSEDAQSSLRELVLQLERNLSEERDRRRSLEKQHEQEREQSRRDIDAAYRAVEDEEARCREAERRARAAIRAADMSERERRVIEQERTDLQRELRGKGVLPAVLDAMKEISRMTAEARKTDG